MGSRLSSTRDRHETGAAQEAQRELEERLWKAEEALNSDRERLQALSKSVEARKREVEEQSRELELKMTTVSVASLQPQLPGLMGASSDPLAER